MLSIVDLFKDKVIEESELDGPLDDYSYLLHHVEIDNDGVENLHHCFVYDHLGNMFTQDTIIIKDGKCYDENNKLLKDGTYHTISGLEPEQEVCWSDSQAEENGIKPKRMVAGMTYKQKAKEW